MTLNKKSWMIVFYGVISVCAGVGFTLLGIDNPWYWGVFFIWFLVTVNAINGINEMELEEEFDEATKNP